MEINTPEDARRLNTLKARGAEKLGINVGSLPLAMSAGFAFSYDTVIEALRTSDFRIHPRMITARFIHTAERLLDMLLLQIGSLNVTALDLAFRDELYAARLRQRAGELTKVAKLEGISADPINPNYCEFCTVIIKDENGLNHITCPTEKQCSNIGLVILLIILITWLTYKFLD